MEAKIKEQLLKLGFTAPKSKDKPFCQICQKIGHLVENCCYNPTYRDRLPPHMSQVATPNPPPATNQVGARGQQYKRPNKPQRAFLGELDGLTQGIVNIAMLQGIREDHIVFYGSKIRRIEVS